MALEQQTTTTTQALAAAEAEDRRLHNMPKELARSCVSHFIAWGHDHKGDPAGYQAFLRQELPNHRGVDAEKVRLFFKNLAASYVERYLPARARGYSEDFLTWWENRPGRGRPKKGNAVSALAYMIPPTPSPVPILAMAKPRKKAVRRFSPEPDSRASGSRGRMYKPSSSRVKKVKPRRAVVLSPRGTGGKHDRFDADDTRLCATPRGGSAQVFTFAAHHGSTTDDDVSINEDDVTLILHNLRSTGSSGPSSKPTSRSTPSPLASPRSPVLLALPMRRSPTMTPAAARASSPSSRPVSPFHYLAKAAAAASTAHQQRLVQPQPRRQLPPLPSLRPSSPAAGALFSSSTASSFFPLSSSASSLNTQHLTSLPSFPYSSSSSTNTAPRAFFTSPRASSPPPVHFTPSSSDTAARIHAFHHRQQQSLEPVYLPRYQEHAPPAYYQQQEARRPISSSHESAFDRLPAQDAFTAMLKQAGKHGFGVDQ